MSYTTSESALVTLITTLTGYTANNTKSGDADAAFKYSAVNGGNCCVIDFAGARSDDQPDKFGAFKFMLWDTLVTFFIIYDSTTIEATLRNLLDNFIALHRDNKRLSNNVTWRVKDIRAFGEYRNKLSNKPYIPVSFLCELKEPL